MEDFIGKETWTKESGAIFLANIADTNHRCSYQIQPNTTNEAVDKCHDASDNILRNPKYLAPLKTLPIPGLDNDATGKVEADEQYGREYVRIFHKVGKQWIYVHENYFFRSLELRAGLELGVDARDVRRPGSWDGRTTITFSIHVREDRAFDKVALRVAPVLTHHHCQPASSVFTAKRPGSKSRIMGQKRFTKSLRKEVQKANVDNIFEIEADDRWVQDFFEPGYTSFPGPNGPISLGIMIRSGQPDRKSGRQVFAKLRSHEQGAVQHLTSNMLTESMGNLETIPPYSHNGTSYPVGRTIMGFQDGIKPQMVDFLNAQEIQSSPVLVDTSWLKFGRVDEFMQFLPTATERGWILMVSDPRAGLDILQRAINAGYGRKKAISRRPSLKDGAGACFYGMSINDVLNQTEFASIQNYCANNIEESLKVMKQETGITDAEIFRVPALYYTSLPKCDEPLSVSCDDKLLADQGKDEMPRSNLEAEDPSVKAKVRRGKDTDIGEYKDEDEDETEAETEAIVRVSAFYPATINGVLLNRTHYLAPKPWGPVIKHDDIVEEAVSAAYDKANFTISYIDGWFMHHTRHGGLHSATNTIREPTTPWW